MATFNFNFNGNSGNITFNVYNCNGEFSHRNGHGFNNKDNDGDRDNNANKGNNNDHKNRNMYNTTEVNFGTETWESNMEEGGVCDIHAQQEKVNKVQHRSSGLNNVNKEKEYPYTDINDIKSDCDKQDYSYELTLPEKLLKNAKLDYPNNQSKFIDYEGGRKFIDVDSFKTSGNFRRLPQNYINFHDSPSVCVVVRILEAMFDEFRRLQTFNQYAGNGQRQELARNGFFHDPNQGPASTICNFCGLVCNSWRQNDDVEAIHRRESPNCPLYHSPTNNVPEQRTEYINAMQTIANGGTERAQIETDEGPSRLVTNEERGTTLSRQQRSSIIDLSNRTVCLHFENSSAIFRPSTPVEAIRFFYVGVADLIRCIVCGGGIRNWNNNVAIVTLIHAMYYMNCQQNIQHPRGASSAETQNDLPVYAITNGNVSGDETQASGHSALATTDYQRLDHPIGELIQAERPEQYRNQQPNAQRVQVRNMSPIHGLGYPYCPYIQHPHGADVTEIQNDQHAITNGHVSTRDEAQTSGNSPLDTTENQRLDHTLGDLNQAEPSVAIVTRLHERYYPNCPQNIQYPRGASTANLQNDLYVITNGNVSTRDEAQISGNYVSEQRMNLQPNDQRVQGNERTRPVYSLSTENAGLSNRPSRTDVTNMPGLNADRVYDTESEASTEVENHRNTNIGVRNRQENNSQLLDIHPKCKLCRKMPVEEKCQSCGCLFFCKECFSTTVECSRCKSTSSQDEVG